MLGMHDYQALLVWYQCTVAIEMTVIMLVSIEFFYGRK